jgi:6,7-dimethyl-8-ribityllumazine synthase
MAASAAIRYVAIVAGRFNEEVTVPLVRGAYGALTARGAADGDIEVHWVPGAFELPIVLDRLAVSGRYDALVAVGAVVRGETPHFDYVAGEAARGLQDLAMGNNVGVGFGILTTDTIEQATARAGGARGNKGWEAALTALEMADLFARMEDGEGAE